MKDKLTPFQELVARALASVSEDELRKILAKAMEEHLSGYDCKQIFALAVDPIMREMIRDELKKPDVLQMLQVKAVSEAQRLVGSLKMETSRW